MRLSSWCLPTVIVLASILGGPRPARATAPTPGDHTRAAESCDRSRIGSVVHALEEQVSRFRAALGGGAPYPGERELVEAAREVARLAEGASRCEALRAAVGEVESSSHGLDVEYRQMLGWQTHPADARLKRIEHEFQQIEALVRLLRREVGGSPTPPFLPPVEPIPAFCDYAAIGHHARSTGEQAQRFSVVLRRVDGFDHLAAEAEKVTERARRVEQLAEAGASCDEVRYAVGRVERWYETFHNHYRMMSVFRNPGARADAELQRLEAMVRKLRHLVGGRPIPAAP